MSSDTQMFWGNHHTVPLHSAMRRESWSCTRGISLLCSHLVQRLVWRWLWEDRRAWWLSSHNHFWMNPSGPYRWGVWTSPSLLASMDWREEWFEFLSTTTSSRLCTALHNSSTLNNLPSRNLWPGGSFFTLWHYFSIPTAVILIRRFRNVHIFDQ